MISKPDLKIEKHYSWRLCDGKYKKCVAGFNYFFDGAWYKSIACDEKSKGRKKYLPPTLSEMLEWYSLGMLSYPDLISEYPQAASIWRRIKHAISFI